MRASSLGKSRPLKFIGKTGATRVLSMPQWNASPSSGFEQNAGPCHEAAATVTASECVALCVPVGGPVACKGPPGAQACNLPAPWRPAPGGSRAQRQPPLPRPLSVHQAAAGDSGARFERDRRESRVLKSPGPGRMVGVPAQCWPDQWLLQR